MLLIRSCGLWGCCFGSFSAAPHWEKAISSNDFDDILHQKHENSSICFAMLDYLQGTQEAKHVLLSVLSKHSKVAFPLGPNPGPAPGTAVAQSVVRSRHHWWSWSPSVWNTPVDLWTFEKGANKQINKQTNKQTNHLSLKSLSISPFFLNPNSLKTILMASFTNIVHRRLCCRPGTISPTLVSGQAKGMEELLPMAYTRSTLQTSSAPNESTVLTILVLSIFLKWDVTFPTKWDGISPSQLISTDETSLRKIDDSFPHISHPSFGSARGFDMYPGSKV